MQAHHEHLLPGLMSPEEATAIRHRVLMAFEYAEGEPDPAERARLLTFVVAGGGARGVEAAGDIAELANRTLAQDLYRIPADEVQVVLVEAGPRLLPGQPEAAAARMQTLLEAHGVAVVLDATVLAVASDHVVAAGDRIEARTVVWANASVPPVAVEPDADAPGFKLPDLAALGRDALAACARTLAVLVGPARQIKRI